MKKSKRYSNHAPETSSLIDEVCPICTRVLPKDGKHVDRHHLHPIEKGGKYTETIKVHRICHEKLHSIWDNNELYRNYNTVQKILESGKLDNFLNWIAKKPPEYYDSTIMASSRKR